MRNSSRSAKGPNSKALEFDLSPDSVRLQAFNNSLARHVGNDFDLDDAAVQVGGELMRYARERKTSNSRRDRLKEKSKRLLKATEKLLAEIESDQESTREVWQLSSAPNFYPGENLAISVYGDRLKQIREWNSNIGSDFVFSMRLNRVIQGLRQTLTELSPRGRPADIPKHGLGIYLAWFWGYATKSNPTPSNSSDFDNPGTAFGWFAKRSVEMLTRHDEFEEGFPGFVETAVRGTKKDWWIKDGVKS